MRLYLAQELVEGESLGQRAQGGTITEQEAREVARQVLGVLGYLHDRRPRVIHRDVKPHNLIRRDDGIIMLVDFGAARRLVAGVTHQATLVGTFGYMPPDQLAGTVDPSSDLYALGATLLHLLTGTPPDRLVGDDLELGAKVTLHVSAAFNRFVRKLCAKSPAKRFPDAKSAMAAMESRGRPLAPVALAAAALLVVAGAAVTWRSRATVAEPAPVAAATAEQNSRGVYLNTQLSQPLHEAAVFFDGTRIWALGGSNQGGARSDRILSFDPATEAITVSNARLPTAHAMRFERVGALAGRMHGNNWPFVNGSFYALGGMSSPGGIWQRTIHRWTPPAL